MTKQSEVEDRIHRAQLAILNPSKVPMGFLHATNPGELNELSFSTNLISVRISGEGVDDLSFVDLPGIARTLTVALF